MKLSFDKKILSIFFAFVSFQIALSAQPEWLTVYVHGTKTSFGLQLVAKIDPSMVHPPQGLHHINCMTECALMHQDVANLHKGAPDRFDPEHFYTFGWSGKLDVKVRQQAGHELYNSLRKLLDKYFKQYGYYPKVRLMSFSYGGEVVLNTVSHLPFVDKGHVHLELLIVACPIRKETEKLIEHPEVDRAYTIASDKDLLQVVDWYQYQGHHYFPNRFVQTYKSNCLQILVTVNDKGLTHTDLLRSFMIHIPAVLDYADACALHKKQGMFGPYETVLANVLRCNIKDPQFVFFKGYNILAAVRGQRKK